MKLLLIPMGCVFLFFLFFLMVWLAYQSVDDLQKQIEIYLLRKYGDGKISRSTPDEWGNRLRWIYSNTNYHLANIRIITILGVSLLKMKGND